MRKCLIFQRGGKKSFRAEWRVYSENDVEQHYASIAYLARVRLADGRVLRASEGPVLAEAKKFSDKFTPADLEPEGSKPGQGEKSSPNPGPRPDDTAGAVPRG